MPPAVFDALVIISGLPTRIAARGRFRPNNAQ
jgi:hypothetical protein